MSDTTTSGVQEPVRTVTTPVAGGAPPSLPRRLALGLIDGALCLLLFDATVETVLVGSPARWPVAIAVIVYFALLALARHRLGAATRAALSLVVMLGLLAFSASSPGGATSGLVMLRQPPGTVLAGATAVAMLIAAWSLLRTPFLPASARIVAGLVAVYGLAATIQGLVASTPYPALVHGASLWVRLPFWLQGTFLGALVLLPTSLLVHLGAAITGRRGSRPVAFFLAVASALALLIVACGFLARTAPGVAQGAGENGPGLRPIAVATLGLPVPRTADLAHVEPQYFAAALGNDPTRIFEFVRDNVAFEPYAGCLRGPRGTLLALAGNSVDRAALLASLLAKAGHRARFVHGTLPDDRVQDLVASIFTPHAEAGSVEPPAAGAAQAAADRLVAAVNRDGALLDRRLKDAGLPALAEPAIRLESLAEETRDHYWVQWWRDGTWVDMDPSFATASPGTAFANATATLDILPDALYHKVEILVRLEESTEGKATARQVLQYSARAADLSGADLVLVHVAGRPGAAKGSASEGEAGQVKPVLIVRGQAVTGAPFRQKPPAKQPPALGFDSLFGGGQPREAAVPVALAETILFEFTAPGGRKESTTREVFDLIGPAMRRRGETLAASAVSARAAAAPPVTDTILDLFLTTGALHAAHLENIVNPPARGAGEPVDLAAGLQRVNVLFAASSDRLLDRIATRDGGVCRFYADSPRVQIAELAVGASDVRLSMDLRRDRARAVGTGLRKEQLFGAQVLRGVVDGHLERLLVDFFNTPDEGDSAPPVSAMSTGLVFEMADASKAPIELLQHDASPLAGNVPADGRARVEEALAAGWVALAPRAALAIAGAPRFAWWQVDRRSGATIAVTDAGLHQATVDLVIVESRENGRAVVFEGAAQGQGALSRACAHPTNFQNGTKAYEYCQGLMKLMKSTGQNYHFTHYLTDFAL